MFNDNTSPCLYWCVISLNKIYPQKRIFGITVDTVVPDCSFILRRIVTEFYEITHSAFIVIITYAEKS